jgi:ABC-2 type transport system ATP-binding protein
MTATEESRNPGPPAAPAPTVVAQELTKSFGGHEVLHALDLEVVPGTIVGIIGPSGCGKTTLIRVLTGVYRSSTGAVLVFGKAPEDFSPADRTRFGYMPQIPVLFPTLTLWNNLRFMAQLYGVRRRGRRRRLRQLLEFVELWDDRKTLLATASGGMQRRLTLASTLVHAPELLFLDEPTAGIDPILRDRFWTRFRELRDQGQTLIVTTQYVGEAALCDQVAVMSEGRIIAVAPPEELRRSALGGDIVKVRLDQWLPVERRTALENEPYVVTTRRTEEGLDVVVDNAETAVPCLVEFFLGDGDGNGVGVDGIAPEVPSFDDVFVKLIETDRERRAAALAGAPE